MAQAVFRGLAALPGDIRKTEECFSGLAKPEDSTIIGGRNEEQTP